MSLPTPYYDRDGITIYCGRAEDVLPHVVSGSIDLVLTDPPYGTTACAWDSVIPLDLMWQGCRRAAKPNAAMVIFAAQPFTSALVMSNPKEFRYCWVWEKSSSTGFLDANRRPLRAHEDIAVFYRALPTYNPERTKGLPNHSSKAAPTSTQLYGKHSTLERDNDQGWKYPRSVLRFEKHAATETLHPTQKPLALCSYLIRTYSNPGDVILDFSTGSGTTLRAAQTLGRRAIGIELSEAYCEIAVKRLQQSVLPLGDAA